MSIIIEKDIPIPKNKNELNKEKKMKENSILRDMEIGDSVFFSWEQDKEEGGVAKLRNKIGARCRYALPRKFSVRLWPIEDPNGFRVWRIK